MVRSQVLICGGTGCTSSGSPKLQAEFEKQLELNGLWDEIKDFAKGLWKKTENVVKKLKNWG